MQNTKHEQDRTGTPLAFVLTLARVSVCLPEHVGDGGEPDSLVFFQRASAACRAISDRRSADEGRDTSPVGGSRSEPSGSGAADHTLGEFRRVRTGMSYSAVVDVLGELGEEMSRTSIPGLPTTVMYGWQNPDGSNMHAMFQGGSLIQKAQFGLR